jgi:hypothetical protein
VRWRFANKYFAAQQGNSDADLEADMANAPNEANDTTNTNAV